MRSHLTRSVFRRLVTNKGFLFRCPRRPILHIQRQSCPPPRRGLFGFASDPEKGLREPDMDPGFDTLLDLGLTDKLKARPPPPAKLAKAFKQFTGHKSAAREPINKLEASYVLRAFQHLRDTNGEAADFGLSSGDLKRARDAMQKVPARASRAHVDFAREVFAEFQRRWSDQNSIVLAAQRYVAVLAASGYALEAKEAFVQYLSAQGGVEFKDAAANTIHRIFISLMRGFAQEGNETELFRTFELAQQHGMGYHALAQRIIVGFYADRNDVEKTKEWFARDVSPKNGGEVYPRAATLVSLLHFAVRNDELAWLNPIFRSIVQSNPDKNMWDAVFLWAAEVLDKGPEEVERMMDVMVRHNEGSAKRPDMATFNKLVESAIARSNPYLAERYIALAHKRGIRPDAKTYVMQMDYRIDAQDLSGAQAAYDALRAEDLSEGLELPVTNKYIRALCSTSSPHYDGIMSVVADLEERDVYLEADTLSALVLLHLRRGDVPSAINTLQSNVYHHDHEERERTRDALLGFCLDRRISTAQAWDVYGIIRSVYPETGRAARTRLMTAFFERRRSDMACHAFGHMRAHELPDVRPVADTYVACLVGIARNADAESLGMVHNMLKMDAAIEPSTRLYNALMAAYTAVGEPARALDFWIDITNSREGPSYASLEAVFRVCEKKPYGEGAARGIWGTMRRMEIEITKEVYDAYVGALAGQAVLGDAKDLVDAMEEDVGCAPDANTLGILYNALPGASSRLEVESWAKQCHPEAWAALEAKGKTVDEENGFDLFNIVREWKV